MSILSLQDITKHFGDKKVISDFTFSCEAGKFICILGSSGCGKTTLLRLIAGLEIPDSGRIVINNKLAGETRKILISPAQREIGFIFQDLALWPHFTVYRNIAFGLKIKKIKNIESTVKEILEFFNLTDHQDKYPGQLSGGQQQLVAIARSLVLRPKILMMDEPLANLDVKLKSRIKKQIRKLKKKFMITIIYVTHNHLDALEMADEIIVLNNGKIEQTGTPDQIRDSKIPFVKEFIEI
jgi:ABC-type Fe3+/spermidine/putrescine transport system ATPase subunit